MDILTLGYVNEQGICKTLMKTTLTKPRMGLDQVRARHHETVGPSTWRSDMSGHQRLCIAAMQHGGFCGFSHEAIGKAVSEFGPQTQGMILGWHVPSLLG
jgi:hypothetical protein